MGFPLDTPGSEPQTLGLEMFAKTVDFTLTNKDLDLSDLVQA